MNDPGMEQRGEAAAEFVGRWNTLYPGEGLLLAISSHRTTGEYADLIKSADPLMSDPWHFVYADGGGGEGRTFRTPQCEWPLAAPEGMLPDPANEAERLGLVMNHEPDTIRAIGAWRWPLVMNNRDRILEAIQGRRAIDFGGLAGPIGYGAIIVDHGAHYRAIYDVPGCVETIFTSHTLEHVEDLALALDCIRQKLVVGGTLIVNVPSWRFEPMRAENWPHHAHTFRLSEDFPPPPADYIPLDLLIAGWADVEIAEDDGECILVIARKKA